MDAGTREKVFGKYATVLLSETLPSDDAGYKQNVRSKAFYVVILEFSLIILCLMLQLRCNRS